MPAVQLAKCHLCGSGEYILSPDGGGVGGAVGRGVGSGVGRGVDVPWETRVAASALTGSGPQQPRRGRAVRDLDHRRGAPDPRRGCSSETSGVVVLRATRDAASSRRRLSNFGSRFMSTVVADQALAQPPEQPGRTLLDLRETTRDQWYDRRGSRIDAAELADLTVGLASAEVGSQIPVSRSRSPTSLTPRGSPEPAPTSGARVPQCTDRAPGRAPRPRLRSRVRSCRWHDLRRGSQPHTCLRARRYDQLHTCLRARRSRAGTWAPRSCTSTRRRGRPGPPGAQPAGVPLRRVRSLGARGGPGARRWVRRSPALCARDPQAAGVRRSVTGTGDRGR